jgi:hypothetical protein
VIRGDAGHRAARRQAQGLAAEDRGQKAAAEVGTQRSEDRGQTAGDRSQKSEVRGKNKEEMDSPVGAAFPDLSLSKVSRDLAP